MNVCSMQGSTVESWLTTSSSLWIVPSGDMSTKRVSHHTDQQQPRILRKYRIVRGRWDGGSEEMRRIAA